MFKNWVRNAKENLPLEDLAVNGILVLKNVFKHEFVDYLNNRQLTKQRCTCM
jgi:hypothetical protein